MDARTGAQRQQASKPSWISTGNAPRLGEAVAVVDPVTVAKREALDATERLSVDPMRATDRYRLVMPYAEQV